MKRALVFIAIVGVVVAIALVFGNANRRDTLALTPVTPAPAETSEALDHDIEPLATNDQSKAADARVAAPLSAESTTGKTASAAPSDEAVLHGRLIDLAGRPVAGIDIAIDNGAPQREIDELRERVQGRGIDSRAGRDEAMSVLSTTADDGSFAVPSTFDATLVLDGARMHFANATRDLVLADARWVAVRESEHVQRSDHTRITLIAGPAIELAGAVIDERSTPIEGARVSIELPPVVFASVPEALDRMRDPHRFEAVSDVFGRFKLRGPSAAGARLSTNAEGFETRHDESPMGSDASMSLVLKRMGTTDAALHVSGVVRRADSSPARGAAVHCGEVRAVSDDLGRYELAVPYSTTPETALVATLAGCQAAVLDGWYGAAIERVQGVLASADERTRSVRQDLVLGPPPLSISGRVLDAERKPLEGWIVQIVDPTPIVPDEIPPNSAEAATHGGRNSYATTDGTGKFEVGGLLEREYTLQAHSVTDFLRLECGPFRAGARDVEMVVPKDARIEHVVGRVIGRDKKGLAGVRVSVGLVTFRARSGYTSQGGEAVVTSADGRFELHRLPRRDGTISVNGDDILPKTFDYADVDAARPFIVEVARRCHFRVEGLPSGVSQAWLRLRDARGGDLESWSFQSGGTTTRDRHLMTSDRSEQLAASEDARTIVLVDDDDEREITSRPITLVPGEIVVVRF